MNRHDALIGEFGLRDTILGARNWARVEVTPDDGYLYPEGHWTFELDEEAEPAWWSSEHREACLNAQRKWQKEVYGKVNLEEARKPINPLELPAVEEITEEHLIWLQEWDSVRDSMWDSAWWNGMWSSAWAYIGSLFVWEGVYLYESCANLWRAGLVPSFDGKLWRLYTGTEAHIVWSGVVGGSD